MAEWADETIERLRKLWDEGLSTAEIGRRLGVSKNAVVGRAHRMNLPARPSPIRYANGVSPKPPRVKRAATATLPPLASIQAKLTAPPMAAYAPVQFRAPKPPVTRPVEPRQTIQVAARTPPTFRGECCWPIGEPGTKTFRFCSKPALAGCPYCAAHRAIAYVRRSDRREDDDDGPNTPRKMAAFGGSGDRGAA